MQTLCLVLAVWLGLLAGLAAVQHHPSALSSPDRATTTVTEQP
jgi:hypothetical protein